MGFPPWKSLVLKKEYGASSVNKCWKGPKWVRLDYTPFVFERQSAEEHSANPFSFHQKTHVRERRRRAGRTAQELASIPFLERSANVPRGSLHLFSG
jgi:hypothetical protein